MKLKLKTEIVKNGQSRLKGHTVKPKLDANPIYLFRELI